MYLGTGRPSAPLPPTMSRPGVSVARDMHATGRFSLTKRHRASRPIRPAQCPSTTSTFSSRTAGFSSHHRDHVAVVDCLAHEGGGFPRGILLLVFVRVGAARTDIRRDAAELPNVWASPVSIHGADAANGFRRLPSAGSFFVRCAAVLPFSWRACWGSSCTVVTTRGPAAPSPWMEAAGSVGSLVGRVRGVNLSNGNPKKGDTD